MKLLCVAALLLSAVAAQSDFFDPEQDEGFPPADGIEVVTGVPEDYQWTSGDFPESAAVTASFQHGRPGGFKGPFGRLEWVTSFKVDNVTVQSGSAVNLQEGENIFLGKKGDNMFPGKKRGRGRPPMDWQFVKLVYNAAEPSKVSVEYGVLKPKQRKEKQENQI